MSEWVSGNSKHLYSSAHGLAFFNCMLISFVYLYIVYGVGFWGIRICAMRYASYMYACILDVGKKLCQSSQKCTLHLSDKSNSKWIWLKCQNMCVFYGNCYQLACVCKYEWTYVLCYVWVCVCVCVLFSSIFKNTKWNFSHSKALNLNSTEI